MDLKHTPHRNAYDANVCTSYVKEHNVNQKQGKPLGPCIETYSNHLKIVYKRQEANKQI